MSDFDACRFDFRFDAKNGLMPAKRKRIERCSQMNYGRLFKCKLCSSLFPSRAQLLEHKLFHGSDYNCAMCGRTFTKRARLRDHVNNDHKLNNAEEAKQEHAYTREGCEVTGLAPELIDSGTITATLSSDTMLINDQQYQSVIDNNNMAYNEKAGNNLLNTSAFSLATSNMTHKVNTVVHDNDPPSDYFSVNLTQVFSSSSLSFFGASAETTTPLLSRSDTKLAPSFAFQPSMFKTETDSFLTSKSESRSGNPSAIAAYLAQLHAKQNPCAINRASYFREKLCVPEETGDNEIVVKREPMDIRTSNDGELLSSVLERFPSKCDDGDEIWDYSSKLNSSAAGDNQAVFEAAVDLSLKTVDSETKIVKVERVTPSEEVYGNSSDFEKRNRNIWPSDNETSETVIIAANQVDNVNSELKLFKIDELNTNCFSHKQAYGFRSLATKRTKTRLSNMVEKLWKNKLIDSINCKTSEIKNETTIIPSGLAVSTTREVYSEHQDESASPPSSQAASGKYCTLQFRACPVCQQLFENSKAMWDHAMTHPEYKKRQSRKRENTVQSSSSPSSIEDKQIVQYLLPEFPITSSTSLDKTNSISMDRPNCLYSIAHQHAGTHRCTAFPCSFPTCDRLFTNESQFNLHEIDHTLEMKLISCPLCSYSCHHVILLEQHLLDTHKLDVSSLNDNKSYQENSRRFRLNEFFDNIISNTRNPTASGGKLAFPTEEKTAANEYLQRDRTNCNISDKIAEGSPSPLFNDIRYPASHEVDTKQEVMLDHHLADGVQDETIFVKSERLFDDHIALHQAANVIGKPQPKLLLLRQVTPAPGNDPLFYTTSVMKISYNNNSPVQQQPVTEESNQTVQGSSLLERNQDDNVSGERANEIYSNNSSTDIVRLYCDMCGVVVDSAQHLRSHLRSEHGAEMGEINDSNLGFGFLKGYSSFDELERSLQRSQIEIDSSLASRSPWETTKRRTKSMLKNYIRQAHLAGGKQTLKCGVLDRGSEKKFESSEMTLHNQAAAAHSTQERPLVCGYNGCDKAFRELKHLKVHQMQHTDLKPLRCELCEYSCRQRNSMNWHMKSQHGLEKHVTADGRTMYS